MTDKCTCCRYVDSNDVFIDKRGEAPYYEIEFENGTTLHWDKPLMVGEKYEVNVEPAHASS